MTICTFYTQGVDAHPATCNLGSISDGPRGLLTIYCLSESVLGELKKGLQNSMWRSHPHERDIYYHIQQLCIGEVGCVGELSTVE